MPSTQITGYGPVPGRYLPGPWTVTAGRAQGAATTGCDRSFVALLDAYRRSGGLARVDEVNRRLQRRLGHDAATLEGWIEQRAVINFDWQLQTWLPWFQFTAADDLPSATVAKVVATLHPAFDDWETAQWFARPNAALDDRAPVNVIVADPAAAEHAARIDRFVVMG